MAEEDVLNSVLNFDIFGTLGIVMWSFIGLIIVGGIVWFVLYQRQFNKRIIVRDETTGATIVRFDVAREFYDKKKNILMWHIKREKVKISPPPKESVSVGHNGKKVCELVRVQSDQYHWLNTAEFKNDALKNSGKYFIIAEDAKRQLADQIAKAQEEKQTAMSTLLMNAIPIIMVAICMLFAYFIFDTVGERMAEVAESVSGVTGGLAEVSKQNTELVRITKEIILERESQIINAQNRTVAPN